MISGTSRAYWSGGILFSLALGCVLSAVDLLQPELSEVGSIGRVPRQKALQEGLELGFTPRRHGRERDRRLIHDLGFERRERGPFEGTLPPQHLVEHDAE